jgi:glutamate synthase domain-containing protein 2/glutamate synthase domain-containing protein 3
MSEDGWFASRYLLRLALDRTLEGIAGEEFALVSLSNRTTVYKGLVELSRIGDFYPDLQDEHYSSRFVLFHSRYCTNTTTAWRRAQPFWALAHNGEISTIQGNVAWMEAIGRDLIAQITDQYPQLVEIAARVQSVVCQGGSDTANLDDMLIALIAGGMSISQGMLALLPEAITSVRSDGKLEEFYRSMSVFLGACDGPAAVVGCDGDEAVAHLDRNGLRPLWFAATKDFAVALSEPTGTFPLGKFEEQRLLGPGETVKVRLRDGHIMNNSAVHEDLSRLPFPSPGRRIVEGGSKVDPIVLSDLARTQKAFGMTKEDVDVVMAPLVNTGKPAIGSMGDDTSPSALLNSLPRRIEDHFALRFAQETSPPIDPIRDAWVFDPSVSLGDRSGLWTTGGRTVYTFKNRILGSGELSWLNEREDVTTVSLCFDASEGAIGLEMKLTDIVEQASSLVDGYSVIVLSDRSVDSQNAAVPVLRAVSRLHSRLVERGKRHRVGIVADTGVWDIHHCSLLIALGADAVCPWMGIATADEHEYNYLKGVRGGFVEVMSMMGVTPASAYCGARLIEAIGLDRSLLDREFPGVPGHLSGIGIEVLDREWLNFHRDAFQPVESEIAVKTDLVDVGEYRHSRGGRSHSNNAEIVRTIHAASGYAKKIHGSVPGSWEAYADYSSLVSGRDPITLLDCIALKDGEAIPLDEVESEESIIWRFMAPGMSEGALSGAAHRTVARAMNLLHRYCRIGFAQLGTPMPQGMGPFANSGEGGFEKSRIGTRDGNTSIQYAGGRFTITPMTASRTLEAEIKFAQGAKPGKGGQLPGRKVSHKVAQQRGCEPGFELVSPPINHNLYSIEDVKLMLESWRHLNPKVNCSLKYVATHGVEMVALGGVNAGANRLHLSDGCGGTGAAKRVDQKHAGIPLIVALPTVQDTLVEEGIRHRIELSVDGGVQNGEQVLKLFLLGADRVGFGTSLLMAIGCSMLRKCHLAGPDPADPSGKRRLGCTPGVATQDPVHIARFTGKAKHIARYLRFVAREVRQLMAERGIRRIEDVVGRRDLLEKKTDLLGKAAIIDFEAILGAPAGYCQKRDYAAQSLEHMPKLRLEEHEAAEAALLGKTVEICGRLTNEDRCVAMGAAGVIARKKGDLGIPDGGSIKFRHDGAAGHFYAAYMVDGIECRLDGVAADSCFTATYGGKLTIVPQDNDGTLTVVGNTFGYGARGGKAYIAARAGNRFGICFRKSTEGTGPRVVVEGVEANAFQYMTGGTALVLGTTGVNLGSGMTGGRVFLLDYDPWTLNRDYVKAEPVGEDIALIKTLLEEHLAETGSPKAKALLANLDPERFVRVSTCVSPEPIEE